MKRIARAAAAALLSLSLLAQPVLAAENKIQIVLQGAPLQFEAGADPFIESGRTLVPLRALSESLGFVVDWEPTTQQITLTKSRTTLILWVDKLEAQVNGKPFTLEVAPKIVGSRTFVPVRFISEQLGANVYWDGERSTVRVTPQGQSDPAAVAFAKLQPTTQVENLKMQANLWVKVTEPGQPMPTELTAALNLHAQGEELYGDLAITMPFMGANLPFANGKLAVRNGFMWAKLDGGLLVQQLGAEMPKEWMPLGSMADFTAAMQPSLEGAQFPAEAGLNFNPAEFTKLSQEILDKVLVTFGPGETKDGKQLTRLDVNMSGIDFMDVAAKVWGMDLPSEVASPKIDAQMTLWAETESHIVRMAKMTVQMADGEMQMEMTMDVTMDPVSAPIAWPADLPATPPADAAGATGLLPSLLPAVRP